MTGRELIVYILENGLEDSEMFDDGIIMTADEKAAELATGVESVKVMRELGAIDGLKIGNTVFFLKRG